MTNDFEIREITKHGEEVQYVYVSCPKCGKIEAHIAYIDRGTEYAVVFHEGCAHFCLTTIPDGLPQDLMDDLMSESALLNVIGSVVDNDSE